MLTGFLLGIVHDLKGFYARRIHFPNGKEDDQVQAVKRKLGARINSELWQYVTKTASGPFVRPKSGRVAVRVITTTGVEMTQVIEEKDWSS